MILLDISSCAVQREGVGKHCWNVWVVLEREGSEREALGG